MKEPRPIAPLLARAVLFYVLLWGSSLGTAFGQATARQGDRQKDEPNEFVSPMILEVDFLAANPLFWTKDWLSPRSYDELTKFRCEGVFIEVMTLRVRKVLTTVEVQIETSLRNPDGNHDKTVRMGFEIQNDGQTIKEAGFGPVKLEESDGVTRTVPVSFSLQDLKMEPMTRLRIKMSLQNR